MALTRIYLPTPLREGLELALDERAHHHLVHVLRARTGEELLLFDGSGLECQATLTHADRKGARVTLGACSTPQVESPIHTTLALGISKGERMDYAIQKCVELGVTRIIPITTRRSLHLDGGRTDRKQQHWEGVAIAAAEQCGRTVPPVVGAPHALGDWLSAGGEGGLKMLLDPLGTPLERVDGSPGRFTLLVGPEGGFAPEEVELALHHGYLGVRLGPRILRTETAPVALLAILQGRFGDLNPGGP